MEPLVKRLNSLPIDGKINAVHHTSLYINYYGKIPHFIKSIVYSWMLMQVIAVSYIPFYRDGSGLSFKTKKLLEYFCNISLVRVNTEDPSKTQWIVFVIGCCVMLQSTIAMCLIFWFDKKWRLNHVVCRVYNTSMYLLNSVFFPYIVTQPTSYLLSRLHGDESVAISYLVLYIILVAYIILLFFHVFADMAMSFNHNCWSVWSPQCIIRKLASFSVVVAISNSIPDGPGNMSNLTLFHIIYFASSCIREFLSADWTNFNQWYRLCGSYGNALVFSAGYQIYLRTSLLITLEDTFWICYVIALVWWSLLFVFMQKYVNSVLRNLDDPDYIVSIKNPNKVRKFISIGIMYGHRNIMTQQNFTKIIENFPNDFPINTMIAKMSLFLSTSKELTLQAMIERLRPQRAVNWVQNSTYLALKRNLPPVFELDIEQYQEDIMSLKRFIAKMSESAKMVYSNILSEITVSLPKNALIFDSYAGKCLLRLFKFAQKYPLSPYGSYFINSFEKVFPRSNELPEIINLYSRRTNYVGMDLSEFHSHVQYLFSSPDIFKNFEPIYRETVVSGSSATIRGLLQNKESDKFLSKTRGPFSHSIVKWQTAIMLCIGLVIPFFIKAYLIREVMHRNNRYTFMMDSHKLWYQITQYITQAYPFIVFNDNRTCSEDFWKASGSKTSFINSYLNLLQQLQSSISNIVLGYGDNKTYDTELLNRSYTYFHRPLFSEIYNETLPAFFTLSTSLSVCSDFAVRSGVFLPKDFNISEGVSFLHKAARSVINAISPFTSEIITEKNIESGIEAIDISLLYVFNVAVILSLFFYMITQIKGSVSRFDLFFMSLRETSKAAVNEAFNSLGHIESHQKSQHTVTKKSRRLKLVSVGKIFWIPLTLFTVLFLFNASAFYMMFRCNRLVNQTHTRSYFSFMSVNRNIALLARRTMELYLVQNQTSQEYESLRNDINSIYESIRMINMFNDSRRQFLCPTCTLSSVFFMDTFLNRTLQHSIFRFVSRSMLFEEESMREETDVESFVSSFIARYFFTMEPLLMDGRQFLEKIYTDSISYTMKHLITTYAFFILEVIALVLYMSWAIKKSDKPFHVMVQLLENLPVGSLSRDTLKILKTKSWNFRITDFSFDSSYYDKVVRSLLDGIVIIDKSLTVVSYNKKAKKLFTNYRFRQRSSHFLMIKRRGRKLFECMGFELYTTGESVPQRPLTDILEDYLLDDIGEIRNYQLTSLPGTKERWYSMTILPIYDDSQDILLNQSRAAEHFALIFRNVKQEIRQQLFLKAQTDKHISIINKIMPPEIGKILFTQEQHSVSMTANNVGISLCDIVSFTPWCAQQTPEQFVNVLGLMFTKFDEACSKYNYVTKIKRIGDCYMAASGIFSQDIDPKIHIRQLVLLGLDFIDAIEQVNAELNTSLQVRVGIAFGGPISAGVMGMHKPAFDIWGELYNEAQKMESSGVPMAVHVDPKIRSLIEDRELSLRVLDDGTSIITRCIPTSDRETSENTSEI